MPAAYRKEIEEKIFNVYRDNGNRSLYNFDELRRMNIPPKSETGESVVQPNVFDTESLEYMQKIKNKFFKN
jgi:hypothetical protein